MRFRKTDVIRSIDSRSKNPIGGYFSVVSSNGNLIYANKIKNGKSVEDNQYLLRKQDVVVYPTEKVKACNKTFEQIDQNWNHVRIKADSKEAQRIVQAFYTNVNKQLLYKLYTNNYHVYITFSDITKQPIGHYLYIVLLNVRKLS